MTPEERKARIDELLAKKAAAQRTTPPDVPSALEALGRGAAQGVSFGFGDELSGGIAAGARALGLGADGVDPSFALTPGEAYDEGAGAARAADSAAQAAHSKTFGAGRIGGLVLGSALPVSRLAKPIQAVAKAAGGGARGLAASGAAVGAAGGLLSGAGESPTLGLGDMAGNMALQGGAGAIGGAVLGPLAPVLARGVGSAARGVSALPGKAVSAVGPALQRMQGAVAPMATKIVNAAEANPMARGALAVGSGGSSEAALGAAKMVSRAPKLQPAAPSAYPAQSWQPATSSSSMDAPRLTPTAPAPSAAAAPKPVPVPVAGPAGAPAPVAAAGDDVAAAANGFDDAGADSFTKWARQEAPAPVPRPSLDQAAKVMTTPTMAEGSSMPKLALAQTQAVPTPSAPVLAPKQNTTRLYEPSETAALFGAKPPTPQMTPEQIAAFQAAEYARSGVPTPAMLRATPPTPAAPKLMPTGRPTVLPPEFLPPSPAQELGIGRAAMRTAKGQASTPGGLKTQVETLAEQGLDMKTIAKALGKSQGDVAVYFKGWQNSRPSGAPPRAK